MIRLAFLCLPYFFCGMMEIATGALRGMGAAVAPMVMTVLGVCGVRITWLLTVFRIPRFHTPQCLFLSYPLTWAVTFAIEMAAFVRIYRRHLGIRPQGSQK